MGLLLFIVIGIPLILFVVGFISSLQLRTKESTISKKDFEKYVDNNIHNEISEKIEHIYKDKQVEYNNNYATKLNKLRTRYLLFFFPGFFYHSKLKKENFFVKMNELAASVIEAYSLEILKKSVFSDQVEDHFEFNPILQNLGLSFLGSLKSSDPNRKHEKEIAKYSIDTGFIDKRLRVGSGLLSFNSSNNVLLDSNVKLNYKDKNKYNISIYNSSMTLLIKNDKSVSYKSIFNGIICIIDKPFFLEKAFRFSSMKWPLESFNVKNLEYKLSYPGIHKIVKIESQSEDPVEIRKLFQPRFADDLMKEFGNDTRNIAVYSDPVNKMTMIGVSNTNPTNYKDLSLNIESPEMFFSNYGTAKGILAKDYYVINRLANMIRMLEDVNAFSHDYFEDKTI